MILTLDSGEKYKVHFRYEERKIVKMVRMSGTEWNTYRDTICHVHSMAMTCSIIKPCVIASFPSRGMAMQHPNDQFCRATGRKIAFGRAIKYYDRETRSKLWKAYFSVVGYPKN